MRVLHKWHVKRLELSRPSLVYEEKTLSARYIPELLVGLHAHTMHRYKKTDVSFILLQRNPCSSLIKPLFSET